MNLLIRDLRFGVRSLSRTPGTTTIAILSLALGVGANAVVFSLVNALLLRPLPVEAPEQLVRIGVSRDGENFLPVSYAEYEELAQGSRLIRGLIGHEPNNLVIGVGDDVREEWMEIVTPNYFSVLGIKPRLGRGFLSGMDRDASPEIVVSDGFWRRRLSADPNVIGQVVKLNGHSVTIAGVTPPSFRGTFTGFDIALWVPVGLLAQALPDEPALNDRSYRFLLLIGRLEAGASIERVRNELGTIATRWPRQAGPRASAGPAGISIREAGGVHPFIAGLVSVFASLLMAIVALVLLIACANVANLLLARGAARRREIAIRLALGARRGTLVRQLLTESVLLAVAGGAGGALLAFWLSRLLLVFRPPVGVPLWLDVGVDSRVLAFTAAVALATAIVFGLMPALHASRADLTTALKGLSSGGGRSRLRGALVVSQVAVSSLLLVCAVLFLRTLMNSRTLDPGFDVKHVLVLSPESGRLGYNERQTRALWDRLIERLRPLPGVEHVTLALMIPLGSRGDQMAAGAAESETAPGRMPMLNYNIVSPGYIAALRMRLASGREFDATDRLDSPPVAMVSEAFVRQSWPGGQPLGRRIRLVDRGDSAHVLEVVGVVRDIKYRSLGETPRPIVYLPSTQWYRADMRVQITSSGNPRALLEAVRGAVREIDPDVPFTASTMEEETAFALIPVKVAGAVLAGAGGIALFLATIGIFGVVSFNVARQFREIGIRMALGARGRRVGARVMADGLTLSGIGLLIGLVAALGATRLMRSLLYGVGPTDPLSFGAIAALLIAVTALACYVPARRATRVNPVDVLRE